MSVESITKGAQNIALWDTHAECEDGGQMGIRSNSLGVICQEILDPMANRLLKKSASFVKKLNSVKNVFFKQMILLIEDIMKMF